VNARVRPFVVTAVGMALVTAAGLPPSADAYSRPGSIARVSVSSTGAQASYTTAPLSKCAAPHGGNPPACSASITPDGRYVVYSSAATNLVPNDVNTVPDVFVRDRATGVTEIESVDSAGRMAIALPDLNNPAERSGGSFEPDITPNGRWVAFTSNALNLVPGDRNLKFDVFVRDRTTKQVVRVSVATGGTEANGDSTDPVISADGRYVFFESDATNLVPGDTNGFTDVFMHDRVTGKTTRISTSAQGAQADNMSYDPSISADARYVAYTTEATTIVAGTIGQTVVVRDMKTGRTEIASVASGATTEQGDVVNSTGAFNGPHGISADGRYVTFRATQSTLVPNDSGFRGSTWDIFVHDRRTGRTERVSVASSGAELSTGGLPLAASESNYPAISPDGRYIAFYTNVSGPTPTYTDAYIDIHDMLSHVTETVSLADVFLQDPACDYHGQPVANGDPSISVSTGGRYVAFDSCNGSLVKGDTNNAWDVFVRDRGLPQAVDALAVGNLAVAGSRPTTGSAVYRPESHDLLVRIDDAQLSVAPALLYGVQLSVRGVGYQVRAVGVGAAASFGLFRVDPATGWSLVTTLQGGFGTVGDAVEVAVPLAALGAAGPRDLRDLQAFAGLGSFATGPVADSSPVRMPR
jgi:Tol biopolymer transport system component